MKINFIIYGEIKIYIYIYTHTHTYIHTHTYTHTHTHTYKYKQRYPTAICAAYGAGCYSALANCYCILTLHRNIMQLNNFLSACTCVCSHLHAFTDG
jgi:hypothetical protein